MSRIQVNFPWVFNNLGGSQPAYELDNNFDAIDLGTITIGTRVIAGSLTLNADDDYSMFLCVPTNDMNLTPPSSMATNFSFFMSNQSTTKDVTVMAEVTIDGEEVFHPVFPGDFGGLTGVKGGLFVYDGSTMQCYPKLFME